MYTICETPFFTTEYPRYWTAEQYNEFKIYLADNPEAGEVEPNAGGIRKIRWGGKGKGKQGGTRVIYYNRLANGQIWLLTLYSKDTIKQLEKKTLKKLVEVLNDSLND
ncbi:transcriptional regulator [Acinetobacter bereziniae]|uniref:transcriptional regulator n=1 Tax=Acinetobacter bereziniae TaxID=106648 RepID=UPI002FDA0A46